MIDVNLELLRIASLRKTPDSILGQYIKPMQEALHRFSIRSPRAVAAFLATVAHESGGFRHVEEIADGKAYEGRLDLGNTVAGDGPRFKGKGLIQLTGRGHVQALADYYGMSLDQAEAWLVTPEGASYSAAWYFAFRRPECLRQAEANDFAGVTRAVNGGMNGWDDRKTRYDALMAALERAEQEPAPVEDRSIQHQPEPEAKPMTPLLVPVLLQGLQAALPVLSKLFQQDPKKLAATEAASAVIQTVVQATNSANGQEALEKVQSNEQAKALAEEAIKAKYYELDSLAKLAAEDYQREEGSRKEARSFGLSLMTMEGWRGIGAGVVISFLAILILGGGGYVLREVMMGEWASEQTKAGIVELLKAIILLVVGYFFGSSSDSRRKTQLLSDLQK